MPELAEVALFARDLSKLSRDRPLSDVRFPNQKDWGRTIVPSRIQRDLKALIRSRIVFRSMGKALLLCSGARKEPVIEIRLGMTGQFHLERRTDKWRRHYFLALYFGEGAVFYADPRRFGRIRHPSSNDYSLGGYTGRESLWTRPVPRVPDGYLGRARISWLLGTGELTGVGNYMANEALGRLGLSPFEPFSDLEEARAVLKLCGVIARESYRLGGNSFGTGYYRLDGTEGKYARSCEFYGHPKVPRTTFQGRPVFSHFSDASK